MSILTKPADRLKKIGLSDSLANHLAGKGISSVMQLANMTTAELAQLLQGFNLGRETINGIKRRAAIIRSLVNNHLLTVRGQTSPAYKALASTNEDNNIINFHEGLESYPELFGSANYSTVNEFNSVLSPAAYLVDLVRYIEEYIVQPLAPPDQPLTLRARRPDIWKIPLDTENTVNEIPYLQLVNEILTTKLDEEGKINADGSVNKTDKIGDALRYMAETIFPLNLPFNIPLEQIRQYLAALQTQLYDIYETFNMDVQAQAREYLKLSAEQVSYLTTPLPNAASLNLAFGNIQTNNPGLHFTGIHDNANLGSLNNAKIFMNQVGFSEISELQSLLYQNINTDLDGANTLLNNLFINQSSNQYHLAYSTADTNNSWADEYIWEDVSYYSTIQRVVFRGELYIFVRTKTGIDTWQYNTSHQNWVRLTRAMPAWSDEAGWNQPRYYNTIQAVAGEDQLFLLGRFADGMHTWSFDPATKTWTQTALLDVLSDELLWYQPQYYSTIKTVFSHKYIFLTGRLYDGVYTWYYNTESKIWVALFEGKFAPEWTDAAGWDQPPCYLTIKLFEADGQIVLLGRGPKGVETYVIYFVDDFPTDWAPTINPDPGWYNGGWNNPSQYMTIRTCVADQSPYLIAIGDAGIEVNKLTKELVFLAWVPVEWFNYPPNWNAVDWQLPSAYLTLCAVPFGNDIMLAGRTASGIQTWKFDTVTLHWSQLQADFPQWTDQTGWNNPAWYSTIQLVVQNGSVLLFGATATGMETFKFDQTKQSWVRQELIEAVIELENGSLYADLNMAVLDRMNRFIRLSNILGWQYEDLDWALLAAQANDITTDSIAALKDVQWIMDSLNLNLWQVTAFWSDLKTYGEGYGTVSQAPFDIVFNQPIPFVKKATLSGQVAFTDLYHPTYAPNPNYQDVPVIWQTNGRTASAHSIILRLMGTLNLDARNLKALIDHLTGSDIYQSPNEIALTVQNLSVFYRYALLSNTLRLSIEELVVLMQFLHITETLSFKSIDVVRIITTGRWMTDNKLNVYQLNYIINSVVNKTVNPGFDLAKVPALLKSLADAATQWYLNAGQLKFENLMTDAAAVSFYNTLSYKKYIDQRGIILRNDFNFPMVSDCLVCDELIFADKSQLISVCGVGNTASGTSSRVRIPFDPNNVPVDPMPWNGAVSIWFKYDAGQTNTSTLFCLYNKKDAADITLVQLIDGNIVLTTLSKPAQIIYKVPTTGNWHLLVISYTEQSIALDNLTIVTGLSQLQIPTKTLCAVALGQVNDSFVTNVAELRLFDASVKIAAIVTELFDKNHAGSAVGGNTNYWPLNEGQGATTAKDVQGDLNGTYGGNSVWSIVYNTVIPFGFTFLDANGHLSETFDPTDTAGADQPFISLWKTIANLRNILNSAIRSQKQGTLQKLAEYYQTNNDLGLYADYMAGKDHLPNYVQTLLAYRFSLSWLEFSLDLDRPAPFISSFLVEQFAANKIVIAQHATITRLPDDDGHPSTKWLISHSNDDVFFVNKRQDALDIFKLLPDEPTDIFPVGVPFNTYDKYLKYNIGAVDSVRPHLFLSTTDNQFVVLQQKDDYVHVTIHNLPGTGNDVVSRIDTFISDLGQLLYTSKTLQLSDEEFASVTNNASRFFSTIIGNTKGIFSLSQLQAMLLFRKLNTTYTREDRSFAKYFYLPDDTGTLTNYVAKLTGWDAQGLRQLSEWNRPYLKFAAIHIPATLNTSAVATGAGGDYAIVGYPLSNAVFIYQLKRENWESLPPVPVPTGATSFGAAVAIQNYANGAGTTLRAIASDTGGNSKKGAVYVYEYNENIKSWQQAAAITASDGAAGDAFGSTIAVSGNTMAIGAPNVGTTHPGKVYVFKYISGNWQEQSISFTAKQNDTLFGNSLSLYENMLVIGSETYAYIFNIATSNPVTIIPPVAIGKAMMVTNGDFVVMSQLSGNSPLIYFITGIGSPTPSVVQQLKNTFFSGICTVAIEDDTLIVNDLANTCFVYYIQDNILLFRQSFSLSSTAGAQPWPASIANGNLVVAQLNANPATLLFYGTTHDINWFGFADKCFRLADQLGVSIATLLGFINLSQLAMQPRTSDQSADNSAVFAAYQDYANKLAGALLMGRTPQEWETVYNPLRNKFLERERDALAGYTIFSLRNVFTDITSLNDLYELLLIDVASSGCRSISRIKAALNSMQLYVERCRMQLEPFTSIRGEENGQSATLDAAAVEWSWMSQYRVWEANREVFLFPENYFDPTLRKDRSNEYGELQNKLVQSNLTNSNAIDAFQSYFHDLENLAGLSVVSTCLGNISSYINGRVLTKNTFFVFARTKNRDEGYYYRSADAIVALDEPGAWLNWSNWQKLNISIKTDSVASAYASSRIFLFWIDYTKQQITGDDGTYNSVKTFRYEIRVYYTFQNANGQWANPHELPDVGSFIVTPGSTNNLVVNINTPVISFDSKFLNIADLVINYTVTGGTPDQPSPFIVNIDDILSLNQRAMWTFNNVATDVRGQNSLGSSTGGAQFTKGTDIFTNRSVLTLQDYIGGYVLPTSFTSWFNDSFTFGLWVNISLATETAPLLYPGTSQTQFFFKINNGSIVFGAGAQALSSETILMENAWYFVVFRYNARSFEQSIFINGVLDTQRFYEYDAQGSAQYTFGSYNYGYYLYGSVADMFLVHGIMPDTDMLAIYKQYLNIGISDEIDNYEWELNGSFDEVQGEANYRLQPGQHVTFQSSNAAPFAGRPVANLPGNAGIKLPDHFNTFLNHSFTIGIWIYSNAFSSGDWPVLGSSKDTPGERLFISVKNDCAFFDFYNSSTAGRQPITTGAFHFLVFTYDAGTQTQSIYVDGKFDNSSTGHLPYTGSTPLNLGAFNNTYATGNFANFFLANEALSAAEILTIYLTINNPNQPPAPPDYLTELNAIQNQHAKRIQQLSEDLFMGGPDYLFSKNSAGIGRAELSAKAAYGKYMWELFYHIPMLIGQLLSSNKQFRDAKSWYEYIFNPTAPDKSHDRFWQLGYFRSLGRPEDIVDILTDHSAKDQEQLLIYDLDPFDPEAIAYLRPGAFEKKTVLNYIANLLSWGDSLFSQYTWETITEAEMLYVLGKELLGKRPDISGSFTKKASMNIDQIEGEYPDGIPQFIIDIEDMQLSLHANVQAVPQHAASVSNFYFGLPENTELPQYQDLVDTRLFEIRNCLNIMGQQQSLALFEPPINPMALVAAGAAGLSLADVPISYALNIPHYRFDTMIGYAKAMAEKVMDFGRQIIGVIEKNDAEQLALLRNEQEKNILDLTTSIKQQTIDAAANQALVLEQSLASANERISYYTNLLAMPVSALEAQALQLNQIAITVEEPAIALHVAAVVGHLVPTVFGFADGDFSPGGSIESAAAALSSGSNLANNKANMTSVSASYARRLEDWDLQLKLAQFDVASIKVQQTINNIQLQSATADMTVHLQQITDNERLQAFYSDKFSNRELYQWMIDQLSSVHYQAFQGAQDLARKAQIAYQFELSTNESYISYGYWNSTRKGLLSGEKLVADLARLEKAYADNNARPLEIQKIVSLKDISITEFERLIKTGNCKISLSEQLYDWDFPGHYNRKIKSVSITIPAIVGPYQSINASLEQLSNKLVTQPDLNTVKFLVSNDKNQSQPGGTLRVNWRPNQKIAISKASGDTGLFELNFNDARYLPFEGTGAVSEWQLSIPQATNAFDLNTISDVILYINYTALDGGSEFRQQVLNLPQIKTYNGVLLVSIKQQFNQAWNTFITTDTGLFPVDGLQFPPNLRQHVIDKGHVSMIYKTKDGNTTGIKVDLTFNDHCPGDWKIFFDSPRRSDLLDILLEIPYSADLK